MRWFLVCLILLEATMPLFCQEKIFSWDYRLLDDQPSGKFLYTIVNEDQGSYLASLVGRKSIQRFYYRNGIAGCLLNQIESPEDSLADAYKNVVLSKRFLYFYRRQIYIGGSFNREKITEFLRDPDNHDFYVTETDIATGNTRITDTIRSKSEEKIITSFSRNGDFYLISCIDKKNEIKVYRKRPNEKTEAKHLIVPMDGIEKMSQNALFGTTNFSDLFKRKSFGIYQNNVRYPVGYTVKMDKVYLQKKTVVFVINTLDRKTHAIVLDLDRLDLSVKHFHPEEQGKGSTYTTLLVDSLLVMANLKNHNLNLEFFNLNTEEKLGKLVVNEQNVDSISNGSLQKTGNFLSRNSVSPGSFQKFCSVAENNKLVLSGYIEDRHLFLSFGAAYGQLINGEDLLAILLKTDKDDVAIVDKPTYIGFNSALNLSDYRLEGQEGNFSAWDLMELFLAQKHVNPWQCDFFFMQGNFFISFYDLELKRFFIYRLSEKAIE
jgi:hypothetical protein